MNGLMHIYTGDGKGKTTAALGLALRAAGCEQRILLVQFFKGQDCGELHTLKLLPNISVVRPENCHGFFRFMSDTQKNEIYQEHTAMLAAACSQAYQGTLDMLILDEVISAYQHNAIDRAALEQFLHDRPTNLELVLTGRDAPQFFVDMADYVTEMRKIKHPYDNGISAREGIEL